MIIDRWGVSGNVLRISSLSAGSVQGFHLRFLERSVSEEHRNPSSETHPDIGRHPKGTLAIIGVYGLLFAIGWLVLYFGVFVPRGALTP
jgi:hypothetical protein